LKDVIFEEVNKPDYDSFEVSVKEAFKAWEEMKKQTGHIANISEEVVQTNEEVTLNRSSRKRKQPRRSLPMTPSHSGTTETNNMETTTEPKSKRRTSQRLAGHNVPEEPNDNQEKEKNKIESDPNSLPRRSGRLQDKDTRGEATTKRNQCLLVTANTHDPNDLCVFIAHHYYSYLEDGKNAYDALMLVAEKWNLKGDAVLEHIDTYEFEANKTQHKRRRKDM